MSDGSSALLLLDTQVNQIERIGSDALVAKLQQAREAAHAAGIPVIFVRLAFRPGHPEVSPANRVFQAIADNGLYVDGDERTQIPPPLTPTDDELVLTKLRVSGFTGSGLENVLRARGIDTLVLTGIATSGIVLSTFTQAADLDFGLVVLSDACADMDDEVHRVLTEKVYPRHADVLTVDEWSERVRGGA